MRLEQEIQIQFKKTGRHSHVFSKSETTLKALLDYDVEKLQELLSITPAIYSQSIKESPVSLSSFKRKDRYND